MSRLEQFTEQFKSKGSETIEKIKETEIYQKLSDRYESLTPPGQKSVRIILILIGLFIILFFPLSQIATSKEFIAGFESKRALIRDLFRTYRESSQISRLTPSPSSESLIGSVNTTLQTEQLLPEQIISVSAGAAEGRLIPSNLMTHVIDVKLAKLNLRQLVDIGTRLSNISHSVKLKDLVMSANPQIANYFDVTYKLYALNVPEAPIELPPEPETKPKKKKMDDSDSDSETKTKAEDE